MDIFQWAVLIALGVIHGLLWNLIVTVRQLLTANMRVTSMLPVATAQAHQMDPAQLDAEIKSGQGSMGARKT